MKSKVGIVILNYVTYELTIKCVNHLKKLTYDNFFVVVVDNHSPNDSKATLESEYNNLNINQDLEVYFIASSENGGYSAGNNIGIKAAEQYGAEYVIVMNNDVEVVDHQMIEKMIGFIKSDDQIAVVGPTIITNDHADPPLVVHRPDGLKMVMKNYLLPLYIQLSRVKKGVVNIQNPLQVYAVSGCFFCIDLQKLKEVDYLDEHVFLYGEEMILGEKLYQRGYKVYFLPKLNVLHLHSETISSFYGILQKEALLDKSMKYYYKAYREDINIFIKIFLRSSWYIKTKIMLPLSIYFKLVK